MTLQELLHSDVDTIRQQLREGFAWWVGELAAMLPGWLKGRGGKGRPVAELSAEKTHLRVWRNGGFIERIDGGPSKPIAADLALPPSAVLTREIALPALRLADLKRLVANDLDRITPFRPEQVYFDIVPLERDEARGRQRVRVAVVQRSEAEAAVARAERCRVSPQRLGVLDAERHLHFDFMGALKAGRGSDVTDRRLLWWRMAVIFLAAANIGILIFKDVDDVAALRGAVELQAPTVKLAQALRRRVQVETDAREALLHRRARNEPLRMIDAVARALPPPQWVQRLEWNGRSVRIVGFRGQGFDILAAMTRVPELAQPREMSSGQAGSPGALRPFDLVAAPATEPRR